ncbi:MAG TPA: tetratricopeptide repeat protein, partial [Aggregatilineales bacterium]|nr:tetratricopeptide repeat protein [Aggregatilineales bacterium]
TISIVKLASPSPGSLQPTPAFTATIVENSASTPMGAAPVKSALVQTGLHADIKNRAIEALTHGNIETAIRLLTAIHDPQPDDLKPLSMAVRLMLDHLYVVDVTDFHMPSIKAKMDAALQAADLAVQANPHAPDGWAMKALALNWAFRSNEAQTVVLTARDLAPNNPTTIAVEAEIAVQLRQYAEARDLLDKAMSLAQASAPVSKGALARSHYVKGNIEQTLGQADAAIADYEAAWKLSAEPYDAADPWAVIPPGYILYQLGPIYLFQNKADIALQEYTAALAIDRQDPFLYYLRGRVYRFLGNRRDAQAEFQRCLDMEPHQWRCMRNLGQIAHEQANWDSAIRFLQPVIAENSQISDDYYYLGSAYVNVRRCQDAIPVTRQGLALLATATGKPYWSDVQFGSLLSTCHAT